MPLCESPRHLCGDILISPGLLVVENRILRQILLCDRAIPSAERRVYGKNTNSLLFSMARQKAGRPSEAMKAFDSGNSVAAGLRP
jgi:hypothetical protein